MITTARRAFMKREDKLGITQEGYVHSKLKSKTGASYCSVFILRMWDAVLR
jgi:hypothetical protein